MKEKLKPCPFCGYEIISFSRFYDAYQCRSCLAVGPIAEQNEDKIEVWNTRVSQWEPIYTAPKDGRAVLVYYKNEQMKGRIVKARYVNKFTVECDDDTFSSESDENDILYCPEGWYEQVDNYDDYAEFYMKRNITHWMPLPSPPEDQ